MTDIYVIETRYDHYDESDYHWSAEEDVWGAFTDKSEAERIVANIVEKQMDRAYKQYVKDTERRNEDTNKSNVANKALADAGYSSRPIYKTREVLTREDWEGKQLFVSPEARVAQLSLS